MKAVSGTIYGQVQGVGFRMYAYRQAERLGLNGWVKNNSDGTVSFLCEGSDVEINYFIKLMERGNDYSRVEKVDCSDTSSRGLVSFEVRV